ncbi:hypothetical protein QE429_000891 [Bacillus sp. SORGH_AS 510]|uniref:DUF3888 domain-containing protein n=1 Tax=Bacillus sp. SORGH_AS_0510 TaxID=3041771 RepID=UPI0027840D73|nr:DUF3888 domain-containing protein [Bacillus sp. SORGH_AS_0510]MDQ1144064.1 hypothetical protein [Bacillus sp. SORGH_AS_0510]
MKKSLLIIISCFTLFAYSPAKAATIANDDVQLREDVIITLLFPFIYREIEKHYGEPKQFYNQRVLKIKKLREGSYLFNVTVQVTTFEGAHNPPYDLVTITFSNKNEQDWPAIDFRSRRLKTNENQ